MENKNLWWGYKHISGTYQAKRYFSDKISDLCIEDAEESPFCEKVIQPFEASGREEALKIVRERCNE